MHNYLAEILNVPLRRFYLLARRSFFYSLENVVFQLAFITFQVCGVLISPSKFSYEVKIWYIELVRVTINALFGSFNFFFYTIYLYRLQIRLILFSNQHIENWKLPNIRVCIFLLKVKLNTSSCYNHCTVGNTDKCPDL